MPARRKEIDKPEGGVRLLGIPTDLDRLIRKYLQSGVMIALPDSHFKSLGLVIPST